jgi:hypothetical protein
MNLLDRECEVFCGYLIGHKPREYVLSKYREFHDLPSAAGQLRGGAFDRTLLTVARRHPAAARLADAYARVALPAGPLRKKLVLLLAILESCAPTHRHVAAVDGAPGVWLWARLLLATAFAGGVLLASLALFGPWHLLTAAKRGGV